MDTKPERPQVGRLSPELGQPIGQGRSWPGWALLIALVLFVAFLVWMYGQVPVG
jgi:hypothetical protein